MSSKEIIVGFHAVQSLLETSPDLIDRLFFDVHRHDQRIQKLLEKAQTMNMICEFVPRSKLDDLAADYKHQGVIALMKEKLDYRSQDLDHFLKNLSESAFLLILDGVQDPHNLGACLRTANAAGVHAVIVPKDKAVGITPVVSKVASGAVGQTPFFVVTNLVSTLKKLQQSGIWIFGASEHSDKFYYEADLVGPIAIVMGSEGTGLRRLTQENCDFLIRIPMLGNVSSLNVSVATGVCLFEAVRQRLMSRRK